MKKRLSMICAAAFLAIALASIACAQGAPPNGPEGQGPDGQGRQGRMPGRLGGTFQLMRTAEQISMLNADKTHALTRDQARKVLSILGPLRDKPKLPADQAKAIVEKLHKVLSKSQIEAAAKMHPRFGHEGRRPQMQGGERPNGDMNGGTPGEGNGERMGGEGHHRMNPQAMKDFNPFYKKAGNTDKFAQRMSQRWDSFFNDLKKRASGK